MSAATRSRSQVVVLFLDVLAVLAFSAGAGSAGGRNMAVTGSSVGPLQIGLGSPAELRAWNGSPVKIWQPGKGNPPVLFNGELWEYRCPGKSAVDGFPCRTYFGFNGGWLTSFTSNDPNFHTVKGTKVGTPLSQVVKSEKGKWSGWGWQCPGVTLRAPKGTLFVAHIWKKVSKALVSSLYLSSNAESFSSCGS